jgi:hypothetical protein
LPETPTLKQKRAEIARASRRCGNPEQAANLRRDYYAACLEDYIQRVVAAAPPLTADQQSRIAALLQYGGQSAAK